MFPLLVIAIAKHFPTFDVIIL